MASKEHSHEVSKRFLQVMRRVVAERIGGITTQTAFAEKVGEFKQNITRIEAGTRYPTVEMLHMTCLVFGVDPAWLLMGTGEMFPADKKESIALLERVITLEKSFKLIKKKVG